MSVNEVERAFRDIFLALANNEKGRLKFEEKHGYPIHAVSLVDHQTEMVLLQGHVEKADVQSKDEPTDSESKSTLSEEQEQEEHEDKKQKSELAVASRLIEHIDWTGKVITGDALYCQRWLCAALRLAGGDYLFLVKGIWKEAIRYGVTSLPATIAIPTRVLKLKQGHWMIENGLLYVKDVTMGEDKSTHPGAALEILSLSL